MLTLRDFFRLPQIDPLIEQLINDDHGLVVRLCSENVAAALNAARKGIRVLAQLDSVFKGAGVLRNLLDLSVNPSEFSCISWVLSVQRKPTLCPECRRPILPSPDQLERLRPHYPSPDNLCEKLFSELAIFRGDTPQQDYMTLLVVAVE